MKPFNNENLTIYGTVVSCVCLPIFIVQHYLHVQSRGYRVACPHTGNIIVTSAANFQDRVACGMTLQKSEK